jgi:predicted outer membrane protein
MLRRIELAAVIIAVAATAAIAEERAQPAGAQPSQANQQQMIDMAAANCLTLGNQAEIALARWAMERTDSDEARELATKLIEDHQQFVSQLKKYASKDKSLEVRGAKTGAATESKIKPVAGTREEGSVVRAGGAAGSGGLFDRFYAIEHRATEECLSLTQECLGKYKGKDFDQAFLGQQIGGHIHMQAKMKAFESEVSPELQKLIKEGQKTAIEHREHAEKLMEKLASRK